LKILIENQFVVDFTKMNHCVSVCEYECECKWVCKFVQICKLFCNNFV